MLPPISSEGTTADDVPELAENVRQVMLKVFHDCDQEMDVSLTDDKKIK